MAGTELRLRSHPMPPSREVELDLDPIGVCFQDHRNTNLCCLSMNIDAMFAKKASKHVWSLRADTRDLHLNRPFSINIRTLFYMVRVYDL